VIERCCICGLAGFIGESKKPNISFHILSKLFEKSEVRGVDASGFYGTEKGSNGVVVFHKEPTRAREFVKKDVWRNLTKYNLNMLLCHARGASKGVGEPSTNINNHPFVSNDKSLVLIHNGRVDECEYQPLKQKYSVKSNCDSEILLRIIENPQVVDDYDILYPSEIISGIKDVYSLINEGHMAVAVGKRGLNGERWLLLFRNAHRPLWVIDTRESLGQIFFISEPTIWEESIKESGSIKGFTKSNKLIEIPENQIWCFRVDEDSPNAKSFVKFDVQKGESQPWENDGHKCEIVKGDSLCNFITELDENEQLQKKEPILNTDLRLDALDRKCDQIIDVVNNIRQYAEQLAQESSICKTEFEELLADLESKRKELEEISTIINR
jgi:hypothetical protein